MKVFKTTLAILAVKAAAQEEPKYGGAIAPGLPSYDQPSNAAPLSTTPTIPPGYAKSSTHLASSVASYTPSSAPPHYTPPEYSRHPTPGSSQAPSPSAPLPSKYGHSDAASRTAPAYIPSSKALSAAESSTPLPTYEIPCYGPQCTSGASSAASSETLTIPKYGVPSSAISSTIGISTTAKAPTHSVPSSAVSSNAKSSLLPVPSYKAPSSAVSSAVGSTTANLPTYKAPSSAVSSAVGSTTANLPTYKAPSSAVSSAVGSTTANLPTYKAPSSAVSSAVGSTTANVPTHNAHSTANLSTYKAPSATPYYTVVSSALTSIPDYEKSSHIPSSTDNPTPYAASSHLGPVHTSLPTYTMTLSPSKYTTEVVSRLTTYCPSATTITHGGQTYTVTSATTLTITNCPCTITKPVYNAPVPTSAANSAISSHGTSSVSTVPAYKPVTTIKTYTSLTSCSAGQELTTVLTSDITSTVTATSTITLVSTPVSAPAVTITKQTTFVSTTVCTAGQTIKTTATRGFESSIMITATETITAAVAPKPAVPSTITAQVTETHYLTCTAGQTVTEKGKPSVVTSGYVSTIPVYKTVTYISTPSDVPSKTPITQITSDDSTTVVTATLDSTVQSTVLKNAPTSTIEASSEHSGPSSAPPPAYGPPSSYASLPSETVNPAPYPLPSGVGASPPMGTGNAPTGTAPASSLVQYSPTATPITYHGSASRKRRSFGMGLGLLTSIASILLM